MVNTVSGTVFYLSDRPICKQMRIKSVIYPKPNFELWYFCHKWSVYLRIFRGHIQ